MIGFGIIPVALSSINDFGKTFGIAVNAAARIATTKPIVVEVLILELELSLEKIFDLFLISNDSDKYQHPYSQLWKRQAY